MSFMRLNQSTQIWGRYAQTWAEMDTLGIEMYFWAYKFERINGKPCWRRFGQSVAVVKFVGQTKILRNVHKTRVVWENCLEFGATSDWCLECRRLRGESFRWQMKNKKRKWAVEDVDENEVVCDVVAYVYFFSSADPPQMTFANLL